MAFLLANDVPVLRATITRPLVGPWSADVEVDGPALEGRVTLVGGGATLVGTVLRGGAPAERSAARIVGGAGGLGAAVGPRYWRNAAARALLVELLSVGGEELAATSDAASLATTFATWVRVGSNVGNALGAIVRELGVSWRVDAAGKVVVGLPTWPVVAADYALVAEVAGSGRADLATEDMTLEAGVTLDGRRLRHVVYDVSAEQVRVNAWS